MATPKTMHPTAAEIWDTLSAINVNDHTDKKGNLTYLSWSWAWGVMMEHYPDLTYEWTGGTHPKYPEQGTLPDVHYYADGSAMVHVTVRIGDVVRDMWLPVMDHRNKSIINPTSRDISDAKMRCLVKCFAMFGLGHYIYAGEDLPQDKEAKERDVQVEEAIKTMNKLGRLAAQDGKVSPDLARECKAARDTRDLDRINAAIKALEAIDADDDSQ